MFHVKALRRDPDFLLVLVLAIACFAVGAFLPDFAWDRLVDRAKLVAAAVAGPVGIVVLRYVLRMIGAREQGRVMAQVAADPQGPDWPAIAPALAPSTLTNAPVDPPVSGLAPDVDVHGVLAAAYGRAVNEQQHAGTDAAKAYTNGQVTAVTDLAGDLGIVL